MHSSFSNVENKDYCQIFYSLPGCMENNGCIHDLYPLAAHLGPLRNLEAASMCSWMGLSCDVHTASLSCNDFNQSEIILITEIIRMRSSIFLAALFLSALIRSWDTAEVNHVCACSQLGGSSDHVITVGEKPLEMSLVCVSAIIQP